MPGANPAADWENAKKEYFALTNEKKPRETFAKFFKTSHTKLSKYLTVLEELRLPGGEPAARAKKFKKTLQEFQTASAKYLELLEKLIVDEKKNTKLWESIKDGEIVREKETTARLKGLKMLRTRLEDYEASFEQSSALLDARAQGMGTIQMLESQVAANLKKGFKRAAAASAAIKAKPTVETWNVEMVDGVRSLTTALSNFQKLKEQYEKKQLPVPNDVTKHLQTANSWVVKLAPWADGDKRKLDEGADVLTELKTVMKLVKECMGVFANFPN